MKTKATFIWCALMVLLFTIPVAAQDVYPSKPEVKTTPGGGNPAKLPPTAKSLFIPELRLKGVESVEINAVVPRSYHKLTFTFKNWDKFPAELLETASGPTPLPPNPCRQSKPPNRLFVILHSKAGQTLGCSALKPQEDFYFLLEQEKPLPKFVYVDLLDGFKRTTYRSSLVSTSGATK